MIPTEKTPLFLQLLANFAPEKVKKNVEYVFCWSGMARQTDPYKRVGVNGSST